MLPIEQIFFIYNPHAGNSIRVEQYLVLLTKEIAQKNPQIKISHWSLIDIKWKECVVSANSCDLFVACGGDGTVASIGKELLQNPQCRFSVLPFGTGNDFARPIGLWELMPDLKKVSEVLVGQTSRLLEFDVWAFDEHIFLNYLSLGFDAKITHRFHSWRGQAFGKKQSPAVNQFFYTLFGVQYLFYNITGSVVITHNSDSFDVRKKKSIIFSNVNSFAGGRRFSDRVNSTDGLLNLMIFENLWSFFKLILGRGVPSSNVKSATSFLLENQETIVAQIDGEPFDILPGRHKIDLRGKIMVVGA